MAPFRDRLHAGRLLARQLGDRSDYADPIVLALPRGGVPVAYPIAVSLRAPLDVCLVRKLGVPGHEELALGAVAEGDVEVLQDPLIWELGLSQATVAQVIARGRQELLQRGEAFRDGRPPPALAGRDVILVDDGLATGSTMQAAIASVRRRRPRRLIVAVPVAAHEAVELVAPLVDEVACLLRPSPFHAVGLWYGDFGQVDDDEVRQLLASVENPVLPRPYEA
jgi:predicted phosphoribosyltransferase